MGKEIGKKKGLNDTGEGGIFMKKAKLWSVLMVSALLMGCGAKSSDTATMEMNSVATESVQDNFYGGEMYEEEMYEASPEEYEESVEEMKQESGVSSEGTASVKVSTERKLIKTVDMELETLEYDKTITYIQDSVAGAGGYIEHLSLEGDTIYGKDNRRYASLRVRIPKDKADSFLKGLDENTTVRSKGERTEDVTLEYVDVESHKKALQVEQERLMAILEQATTVEEIISIESRLSEVRYEIQNYESRLRTFDNLVDYTTVNLDVYEVEKITEKPKETAVERMLAGFLESISDICHDIKEFIIGFVISIPYLIVYGIIGAIIVLIVKKIRKRRKMKKEKQEQAQRQK